MAGAAVWWFIVSIALFCFVFVQSRRGTPGGSGVEVGVRRTSWLLGANLNGRNSPGLKVDLYEGVNDSLIELYRPLGIPNVQVLFFHGLPLGRSSKLHLRTWECGDGSSHLWPQTWLVEECPGAHVFVVRYRKRFDMNIVGENLLSDLIHGKIGQVRNCPVVLVGHSMGGLVIKELCCKARDTLGLTTDSSIDKVQLENFLRRIRGIFYYATPHHGIEHIAKAADLLHTPLFEYFETLSTTAVRLNDRFRRLCGLYPQWDIRGLAEALPVKSGVFRGIVVAPEATAREGVLNVETADHFSISKPPSKRSRRFYALTQLLEKAVGNAKVDACPRNSQYVPLGLIDMDSRLQEVKKSLEGVTSLCLTGMGGSGKSTLAKVVFNDLGPNFEYTCFVSDVKLIKGNEESLKEEIWNRMYQNGQKVERESDWPSLLERQLLLVLDDLSTERDINVLSDIANGPNSPSSESRYIATSRVKHLLDNEYEVPLLHNDLGLQLFESRAFPNQITPPSNLASLVEQIVNKCEGLPLTLEVVGQYLKTTQEEEDWKEALHALQKAEKVSDLDERLWKKLRLSYDGLQEDEKQVFLDATTFFDSHKWTLREAKLAWSGAYHVSGTLLWRTLHERSLVYNVKDTQTIKVHEQLKSLGQKIASESHAKCRVWERWKALELLQSTNNARRQNVHALRLERNWSAEEQKTDIASSSLRQLRNLRFLQIDVPFVIQSRLEDKWFPRNLVLLSCTGLQLFDPARLSDLRILDLRHIDAESLPNAIGQMSELRIFRLQYATNLRSLPDSIEHLSRLEALELAGCSALQALPAKFGRLSSLKNLILSRCSSLRFLPESFGSLSALERVRLLACQDLQTLPESFGQLSALTCLEIERCYEFHSLPESFGGLSALDTLTFFDCRKLVSLPDSFGNLPALSHLEFERCSLNGLPKSIGKLVKLIHLALEDCPDMLSLPNSVGNLGRLQYLKLTRVSNLRRLPHSLARLKALRHLIIDSTSIKSIPDYIKELPSLQTLELSLLRDVDELPPWLGQTGQNSAACCQRKFQVRDQRFSLIEEVMIRQATQPPSFRSRSMESAPTYCSFG